MPRMTIAETIAQGSTPFFRLDNRAGDKADVTLYGIPFDSGTTYRPGARFGPYGVRRASMSLGGVAGKDLSVFDVLQVADGGNLLCSPFDLLAAQQMIFEQAVPIFHSDTIPIFVGGDHSCTLGLLQAAAQRYGPVGVIHFDAHSDTSSDGDWDTSRHHGTVFRNAIEDGCLNPHRFVQVGLRGPYGETNPHGYTESQGGIVFEADMFDKALAFLQSLPARWHRTPVYVTVDIDVIDPAFAPGTGTPVCGGLQPQQIFHAIRSLQDLNIIGADLMEIAPDLDHADMTSLLGAHILFEYLAVIARSHVTSGD